MSLSFNKFMAIHLAGPEQSKVWSVSNFHVRRDCKFDSGFRQIIHFMSRLEHSLFMLSANDDAVAAVAAAAAATVCDLL